MLGRYSQKPYTVYIPVQKCQKAVDRNARWDILLYMFQVSQLRYL